MGVLVEAASITPGSAEHDRLKAKGVSAFLAGARKEFAAQYNRDRQ
ncbi:hypothetical protein [Aquamicrobium sp. LC103]|nr:hypothetical protein [Aquamicrobium sp. LC103]